MQIETFSKKEREKKKSIKLKDKKEKAEDRKANAGKGKTLDEMMAYIDENDNIMSTDNFYVDVRTIDIKKLERSVQEYDIETFLLNQKTYSLVFFMF